MFVIYVCDSIERFHFFRRFIKSKCQSSLLVTFDPIVKVLSLISNVKCMLITKTVYKSVHADFSVDDLMFSIDYLNGKITEQDLIPYASSIIEALDAATAKYSVDTVVIWNGQQLIGRVASQYAIEKGYKRLFLEISNLPNKLFADPIGVNALSSLMNNMNFLPFHNNELHANWISEYIKSKEQILPQSRVKLSDKIYKAINVVLKKAFSGFDIKILNYNRTLDLMDLESKFISDDLGDNYIFLPLQVTSDTQIKLHSEYTNIDALIFALDYAKVNKVDLVVKLHPAETSQEFVDKLITLVDKHKFTITNNNTVELIKNSKAVITINSTVGLEAKIFGKEVIVLGRAFYSTFDDDDLKSYIHNYLVDGIDYFSNDPIPSTKVEELLARAR